MSLCSRLFVCHYDRVMARAEAGVLGRWRREILGDLSGRVLELGAGSGANLKYYPSSCEQLALLEPNAAFRELLQDRCRDAQRGGVQLIDARAEALPFADQSLDAVVATLVLCSVQHPITVLEECSRVLVPGGKLVVIEHVLSARGAIRWVQRLCDPFQKLFADGCSVTRDTRAGLEQAGFDCRAIQSGRMRPAPLHVRDCIYGAALKP